jgi:PEP-CTERM motif
MLKLAVGHVCGLHGGIEMKKFLLASGLIVGALASASSASATCIDCGIAPGVPEPSVWAMLIVGIGAIGVASRLRRRAGQPV